MEFRQLEAFVNAVKYKSFSKAADASFLTQPTISAHINNLENEMGTTLVNRTGREITLTKQGELFYPYAIDMLHTRSQALATVQAQCEAMDGVLDVYASSIPGQYYLPRLIGEFHAKCPKIRFYVDQSDSKTVIENVMSQKGEIGLTGYKMHNSLVYEPVFMDELVLIVPDTERYARWKMGSTVSFRDFEHETFILREEGSGTKQEMEKAEIHGVPVFKNVDVIARMNSTETIKQAVAGGLGISILSRMAAGEKEGTHRIKYFKIDGLEKKRTFYMVYSKNIRLSPIAEAFRDLVIDYRDRNWQQDIGRFM